jgi:hypothetical protein
LKEWVVRQKREEVPLKPIGFALAAVVAGLAPAAQAAPERAPQANSADAASHAPAAPRQGDLFGR